MGEYDHALPCVAAANILMHSAPGTQTKEAMKCAGFNQVDIEYDAYLLKIENQNKIATELLQLNGNNRSALKRLAPILDLCKIKTCVTATYSRERQDQLSKASTAGSRFHATGGEFLNSDDLFIAKDRKQRNGELKILKPRRNSTKLRGYMNQKVRLLFKS